MRKRHKNFCTTVLNISIANYINRILYQKGTIQLKGVYVFNSASNPTPIYDELEYYRNTQKNKMSYKIIKKQSCELNSNLNCYYSA